MTKKAIALHLKKVLQDYLNTVKNAKKSDLEKPFIPQDNTDFILAIERCLISSYLLGMIHAEEENPDRKINAGDEDIPPVPFAQAIDFLKARVPMTKKEWEKLEPKLRFRAFTVAKLGTAVEIETAKQILVSALEKGESYSQTWETLNDIFGKSNLGFKPGYWENVFRTNTQTAYMAGKLQQYEKTPGIVAYQLLVIEDVRTSKICRNLITKTGRGLVLSVDDDFWKTKGFPPYHFQCRSSVRAIFKSQIKAENIKIDHSKHLDRFKPGEGFGGNPIHKESWWRMTKEMVKQAVKFDIFNDIEKQAKANGLYNYSKSLVSGTLTFKHPEIDYFAEGGFFARPNDDEIKFAKLLEDNGNTWYFTPREKKKQNIKSYDGIFNGKIADMKVMSSKSLHRLAQRIAEADKQKSYCACLQLTVKPNYTKTQAIDFIKNVVLASKYKDISDDEFTIIENVKEVCLAYEGELLYIKK